MAMFDMKSNCTNVPDNVRTDAGVAGAGTLLSYIITNCASLLLSAVIILLGLRKSTSAPICRKLLIAFSDQQIITGIGIQSVGLAKMKHMVAYHYFIIWLLSLLSTATNLATLLALVNDFKRDWVLRWLRQFFMLVNMFLGVLSGIFILQTVMKNLEPRLPIACVWNVPGRGTRSDAGISITGTIAVIVLQVVVFIASTLYLHARTNPRWVKSVQVVGLVMLIAMGVGATARVVMVSQAFGTVPDGVNLEGPSEKDWSYGQLLPLLLLVLPLINLVEVVRGEVRVPENHKVDGGSGADGMGEGLLGQGGTELRYQPNPIFGKR
ncbi:hypothetical protein CC80DRAFT_494665 [Byssothecium circinans]|uniref:Uncharacterized protein n=1 Tax=Byssothecium circinans TaxID=147558 RepID=A0A6A5TME7_9PLEO|nr:hypothetical protein CC80DRAFT_494665 [Byssothecium circinans]